MYKALEEDDDDNAEANETEKDGNAPEGVPPVVPGPTPFLAPGENPPECKQN